MIIHWKNPVRLWVTLCAAGVSLLGCSTSEPEVRVRGPAALAAAPASDTSKSPDLDEDTGAASAPQTWLTPPAQPVELGHVRWGRDLDAALAASKRSGKPVLLLFDEVPGCHTVISYGETVLTHPLIVEAAETLFEPVVVYNNVEGRDARVLAEFREPAWNNPVVRIIDAQKQALVPRLSGDYTLGGLAEHMARSLREPPTWLTLLAREAGARRDGVERQVFSMFCFWSGEASLGRIEGVVQTSPGFAGGREVVEVVYDPEIVSNEALRRRAQGAGAAMATGVQVRPSLKDDKYNLIHSSWRHVPMTPLQATLANGLVAQRRDPHGVFSPRQRWLHAQIAARADAGWTSAPGQGALLSACQDTLAGLKR